jgi:serine/threonine protein kinase
MDDQSKRESDLRRILTNKHAQALDDFIAKTPRINDKAIRYAQVFKKQTAGHAYGTKSKYNVRRYLLHQPLGDGTIQVALKEKSVSGADSQLIQRLTFQEAYILQKLKSGCHPNIVAMTAWYIVENAQQSSLCIEMEFCKYSAATMVYAPRRNGEDVDRLARIPGWLTNQTANALAYVHAQGIIHCDIKLDNVLVTEDGRVKLCDFDISICHMQGGKIGADPRANVNSCGVRAPETLCMHPYCEKVDIWALGVMYVMLKCACARDGPVKHPFATTSTAPGPLKPITHQEELDVLCDVHNIHDNAAWLLKDADSARMRTTAGIRTPVQSTKAKNLYQDLLGSVAWLFTVEEMQAVQGMMDLDADRRYTAEMVIALIQ